MEIITNSKRDNVCLPKTQHKSRAIFAINRLKGGYFLLKNVKTKKNTLFYVTKNRNDKIKILKKIFSRHF